MFDHKANNTLNLGKVFLKLAFPFIFIAILGAGEIFIASLLFQTNVMTGLDGYYYVLQITSLKQSGHFYFPTNTPAVLLFLSALSSFTPSVAIALKLFSLLANGVLCLGVFALIKLLTENKWLGLLGICIVEISSLYLFFVVEFLSQLGGIAFIVWAAISLIKYAETRRVFWLITGILLTVTAALSHRSIIFIAVVGLIFAFIAEFTTRRTGSNRANWTTLFFTVSLLLFPVLLASQKFFSIPEWLLAEFRIYPELPFRRVTAMESLQMLFVVFFFGYRFWFCEGSNNRRGCQIVVGGIVLWSILVSFNPFLNHQRAFNSITGRLDVLLFLQAAVSIPLLISILGIRSRASGFMTVLLLASFLLRFNATMPLGVDAGYLERRLSLIEYLNKAPIVSEQCERPLIVAQHGDQFVVRFVTGLPSQQRVPNHDDFGCVFWLIHQKGRDSQTESISLIENNELQLLLSNLSRKELLELRRLNKHIKPIEK